MHGKTSLISHDGTGIFAGLPTPLRVARYHSLVIKPETMPPDLRVMATADDDGAVMGFAHREHPVIGVQFHPESAATEHGYAMVARFLNGDRVRIETLPKHADDADTPQDLFMPWTPSEDMRWRPFVPPPNRG
jgi:GMP synthase-like glutamine amidotransferase